MEPKVTIVVLTYNLREYVSGALDSILQQKTDFPFRIRIVGVSRVLCKSIQ